MVETHSQSQSPLDTTLHKLHHYLPSQGPLRDFIHHNTLHAFQDLMFHDGLQLCSQIFGTKVYLSFSEYQKMYRDGRITENAVQAALFKCDNPAITTANLFEAKDNKVFTKRIGTLRHLWKETYKVDIDHRIQPLLFRYLSNYLDQGISHLQLPSEQKGFLSAMRDLDDNGWTTLFFNRKGRARELLHDKSKTLEDILKIVVGSPAYYENYLFDQQFSHPGWSGLTCYVETFPEALLTPKQISLHDLVFFELLLEMDYLDHVLGNKWQPISALATSPVELFAPAHEDNHHELRQIWQEALEESFYASTFEALHAGALKTTKVRDLPDYQAYFCIDDRESSLRTHLERFDSRVETFATPGFFGVEFFFKPDQSKFLTKLCPAPVTPKFVVRETNSCHRFEKDIHFGHHSHSFFGGWLISQTVGFWSAVQLFFSIFRPTLSTSAATSLRHTDTASDLTIENSPFKMDFEDNLQVGYTLEEMADRVQAMLKSTGLVKNFAKIIYLIGHGSSSVNNPHYAAYDCGACSGRPGSVNARVFSHMANNPKVRILLEQRGISIPKDTIFVGGIHDTTRDDIEFYDVERFGVANHPVHQRAQQAFRKALDLNAKERVRRFENVNTNVEATTAHKSAQTRSVSLFEPRPELNHATNALCIVGGRYLTKNVFLDRRSFLNSYDPELDPEGEILTRILSAAVPVCGGINLEYYFSRVDNLKMGAGTKLPHNVVGLIAVANGADGDLRPGLPSQMIEVHDPLRLMIIVEHNPSTALNAIQRNPASYEWVKNQWVKYACIDPKDKSIYQYENGRMIARVLTKDTPVIRNIKDYIGSSRDNLAIGIIEENSYE